MILTTEIIKLNLETLEEVKKDFPRLPAGSCLLFENEG